MAENPPTASEAKPAAPKSEAPSAEREALLKKQWLEFQRQRGLKTTAQRELIVDVFLHGSDHVSIEELLTEVRTHSAKVGYATVYRTMKLLTDAGLAALRQFGDGQTRYEVAGSQAPHHDHLICMKCGLILEFENHEIEELQDGVAEKLGGFKIMQHKLELYGLCPKAMGVPSGNCPDENEHSPGKHSRPIYLNAGLNAGRGSMPIVSHDSGHDAPPRLDPPRNKP